MLRHEKGGSSFIGDGGNFVHDVVLEPQDAVDHLKVVPRIESDYPPVTSSLRVGKRILGEQSGIEQESNIQSKLRWDGSGKSEYMRLLSEREGRIVESGKDIEKDGESSR
ncbi:hypothetical protein QAD02_002534 [Eretmocerus hayati]|uniref:Uncharacterized protein n=1 Tax=Eretmocerus hayati TaxID=131215 RepID=A0ACC2NJ56_9HYME|nr:hypothetical protein QAD02_002534 [Eretmocerus hayati]